MRSIETIQKAWNELSLLVLTGPAQWEHGLNIARSLIDVKSELLEIQEKQQEDAQCKK